MATKHQKWLSQQPRPWYPWSIQVEFTEGCNRRCWFCGIQGLSPDRQKGTNHMDPMTLRKTFRELNEWLLNIRVEVNSHGEATLHPQFMDMIQIIRDEMPPCSISLQTNSEVWQDRATEFITDFFWAGGNLLIINAYKPGLYEFWADYLKHSSFPWVDYYWDNPTDISGNKRLRPNERLVLLWDDLGRMNIARDTGKLHRINKRLHNSGGNGNADLIAKRTGIPKRELPLRSKCSKVFREMILSWDGTIPICCQDWQDIQPMGNVLENHIRDMWYGEKWELVRKILFHRRRDLLRPCVTCDDPTTRVGLLPNPGKLILNQQFAQKLGKFLG